MNKKNDVRRYPAAYISSLSRQILKEELGARKVKAEDMQLLALLKTLHSVSEEQERFLRKLEEINENEEFDRWLYFEIVEEIMVIGNSGR